MTATDLYTFRDQQVRTVVRDGAPWFVLRDIMSVLGIGNPTETVRSLDNDEFSTTEVTDSIGREQSAYVINEPGLYSLILRSRKAEARDFKRWVTHEVLPAVRGHGVYATDNAVDQMLADPDSMIRALTALKDERTARAALESQAEADRPKVLFADAVATSHTTVLVGDLAKILRGNDVQVGANRLFEWLREDGFLIRRKGADWNMPTQRSMELGLFRIKETAVIHTDGHTTVSKTPKVTGKGQAYFISRYSNMAVAS